VVPAIYVSAGTGRASRRDRQFVADVFGGHEEGCCEGVGLALHFFHAPDLAAVDEVPELVSYRSNRDRARSFLSAPSTMTGRS